MQEMWQQKSLFRKAAVPELTGNENRKVIAMNTKSIPANNKLEMQNIIEKILIKHGIYPSAHEFFLKLRMPHYDDLIIEKEGAQVLVGHYYHHPSGDLLSDPVLAFDYNGGHWFSVGIEQTTFGDTVCSYVENGKRMIFPARIKEFKSFQRMFASNIRAQGWLEKGAKVE